MIVCKCDRCGTYIDKSDIPIIRGYFNPEDTKFSGKSCSQDVNMQLCYRCYDKLLGFLRGEEEK